MAEKVPEEGSPRRLFWTRSTSLTARILAVNIIALALLAGSLFYLDSYRKQLLGERFGLARTEAEISADALEKMGSHSRTALLVRIGTEQHLRLRIYNADGKLTLDSFALAEPSYRFVDPASQTRLLKAAQTLDNGMDWLLGAPPIPPYRDPAKDVVEAWPELAEASGTSQTVVMQRSAPDLTPVISAATPLGEKGEMLLVTRNAPDITQHVRDARQTLAIVLAIAFILSIQLSLFLARTIVVPLRALVRAAIRVRLGRDRAVVVPRLPERRDEIGLLARALSDMTTGLRQRIDAVEAFAADVAHEIKNPLASLRSALESLEKVQDPALRQELTAIAAHDVRRIDRLVTEIADASRIDAELSRTQFLPVDLKKLANALVKARASRGNDGNRRITVKTAGPGPWIVPGDASRLERVLENLLDNAVSFSPDEGAVMVLLQRHGDRLTLSVSDEGPGIPEAAREKVFERFHSLRPAGEDFGSHSGLGLAIARTIIAAHDGTLIATDRPDGHPGACLVIDLPAAEQA